MRNVITSLIVLFAVGANAAFAEVRYFEGEVVRMGDAMPVRLRIDTENESNSTLDIPQLWYAEEPLPASIADDGNIRLGFPFGLGDFSLEQGDAVWMGSAGTFAMTLTESAPPPYSKVELNFGARAPELGGALYLPEGEGPFPAVIIIGGSGVGARDSWEYRSKGDYFARLGVAALIYDRRPYDEAFSDGSLPDFWTHADDISAARDTLASHSAIDEGAIGLMGGSQGVWLSTIAEAEHGGFAYLIMTGVPAVSPGQQQFQLTVHGMLDDGLPEDAIADAIAYQRLYFYVARTGEGWETLQAAMDAARGSTWFDYMDQPQSLSDLDWWRRHEAYEPRGQLTTIDIPILAMTGESDWITPHEENLPLLEYYAEAAGNDRVVTMVIPRADHRLERQPYTDEDGQWHWFEIASEAREAIPAFLQNEVGLSLAD